MIIDMIANFALITMFLFFYNQWSRRLQGDTLPKRRSHYLIGALHGVFAVLLMFSSVEVSPATIVDMRQIMIVSSAFFGGIYASLITAVFVAVGRVVLFNGFNTSSVTAIFSAVTLAIGSGIAMKYARSYWSKWSYSLIIAAVLLGSTLYYLLGSKSLAIIPGLMAVIIVGGLFTAALITYFSTSNRLLQELRRSEKRYRELNLLQESIFQSAFGISIIVSDIEGNITRFNRGAEIMLGYKADEMIGTGGPYVFFDQEEIASRAQRLSQEYGREISGFDVLVLPAKGGASEEGEWTFIRKDGTRLTVNLVITAVMEDGEIIGFMGTGTDITERNKAEETLRHANGMLQKLSFMDGLTGISNRRHFDEVLESEWRRAERSGAESGLSLLMLDIDYFKKYNDTYGHQLGDECLKKVAEVLKATVARASDLAARYGGEEFAVILPDTDLDGAVRLAEKLRIAIAREAIPHAGSSISDQLTFSIGTATMIPRPEQAPSQLIARADEALYEAKASGRNAIRTRDERNVKNDRISG
jgi:diguanylate cyclase (GGDEF)-like protein/PAS domain S-box-containing protein